MVISPGEMNKAEIIAGAVLCVATSSITIDEWHPRIPRPIFSLSGGFKGVVLLSGEVINAVQLCSEENAAVSLVDHQLQTFWRSERRWYSINIPFR